MVSKNNASPAMPPSGQPNNSGNVAGAGGATAAGGVQNNGYGVQQVRTKRLPNMFILYYMEMYRRYGGNMYCTARECGRRWRMMSYQDKQKYRMQYIMNRRQQLIDLQAQRQQALAQRQQAASGATATAGQNQGCQTQPQQQQQQNPAADEEK